MKVLYKRQASEKRRGTDIGLDCLQKISAYPSYALSERNQEKDVDKTETYDESRCHNQLLDAFLQARHNGAADKLTTHYSVTGITRYLQETSSKF